MQTFENLILQNCSTEIYDIAHTHGPWVCVIKVVQMVVPPRLEFV